MSIYDDPPDGLTANKAVKMLKSIREAIEKGSISRNQKAQYKLETGLEFPPDAKDAVQYIEARVQRLENYLSTHDKQY